MLTGWPKCNCFKPHKQRQKVGQGGHGDKRGKKTKEPKLAFHGSKPATNVDGALHVHFTAEQETEAQGEGTY